ncbi:MAG: STAS domain-containing protein [Phycisphaerae bacterium]|nr:STAS domain-containing protein [Phycisphaerae bacterium]
MSGSHHDKLTIETVAEPAGHVVRIGGDIDLRTSPELRGRLLQALEEHPERLIIDLTGVSYMDSSGVGTVVEAKRKAERGGTRVILNGLQPRVRSVFEITQLDKFFTITNTIEDARTA